LEDLIELAEQKASCELYAILKRDDEKVVTERAYDNPAFLTFDDISNGFACINNKVRFRFFYLVPFDVHYRWRNRF
jgi:hypothetical protein